MRMRTALTAHCNLVAFQYSQACFSLAVAIMSELSEPPELEVDDTALDAPEDKLSAELAPEDRTLEDEDAALLDAALGEPTAEGAEGTEGDGNANSVLEESNDSVNIEDPVREGVRQLPLFSAHPDIVLMYSDCRGHSGDRGDQGARQRNGGRGREAEGDADRGRKANVDQSRSVDVPRPRPRGLL